MRSLYLLLCLLCLWGTIACQSVSDAPPANQPATTAPSVLERVKQRGKVVCGVNGRLLGFSHLDAQGRWSGIEIDFCRAIASAVLGEKNSVTFRPIAGNDRFTALKRGEIDVLMRDTAWTLTRAADPDLAFAPVIFYDSQSILVRRTNRGFPSLTNLNNQAICTEAGDSQQALQAILRARNLSTPIRTSPDTFATIQKFSRGECAGLSLATSQLQSWQRQQANPSNWRILPINFGRDPLSPVVSSRDPQWHSIVSWIVYATIFAEEQGIHQRNFRQFQSSQNPDISRFMGTSGSLGISLGLPPDWTTQILQSVGSYRDIYDRNFRNLPRRLNQTQANGGLLFSMPFR